MQIGWKRIAISLLVLFTAVSAAAATAPHCSMKTGAGRWGFTTRGTIPSVGDVAAVGTFTADVSGNLSGRQTRSIAGDVAEETFTGTFTVNSDCTGTDVIQVYEGGILVRTSTLKLVYEQNGRAARAIFQQLLLPNGAVLHTVLTIDATRITPRTDE